MVKHPKRGMILFGSTSIFSALVLVAVVTSLTLASRVNNTISNLELHYDAMDSGTMVAPAEPHSLPSLTRQIGRLRPITYGIIGGSLEKLFGTLLALVWIDRQRHEQAKQAVAGANLADELRIAEEFARERNQELALLFDISGTFAEAVPLNRCPRGLYKGSRCYPGPTGSPPKASLVRTRIYCGSWRRQELSRKTFRPCFL